MTITEEKPTAEGFDPIELEILWQSQNICYF